MRRRALFAILVLAGLSASAAAEMTVSGTISTTTWTKANGPYRVAGTITVPAGNTLTIEPGVDVLFDADVSLTVRGRLVAIGTSTDSIRFLASAGNDSAEWGGIRITGGDSSTIAHAHIAGARADNLADDIRGGGIFVFGAGTRIEIFDTVFRGNAASYGGGIHARDTSTVTLARCTFRGNAATYGGGIGAYRAIVSATSCMIAGNSATNGGGVRAIGPNTSVMLDRCTIVANTAEAGGAIWMEQATFTVRSSILRGNAPQEISRNAGSLVVTYSDVQYALGTYPGTENINADPLFANATAGDYRLLAGSPCIDEGSGASPPDPNGTIADMGAFWGPQGTVKGTIRTATWTAANGPYRVTGTITIPAGNTLTIEPGVDVLFDDDVRFTVNGRLVAIGTATDSIRFLKGTRSWRGIKLAGGDSSALAFVRISGGDAWGNYPDYYGGGVYVLGPDTRVSIADGVISEGDANHSGGGIAVRTGAVIHLDRCAIRDNTAAYNGAGVYVDASSASFVDCTIESNRSGAYGGGIDIGNGADATFIGCTITGNTTTNDGGGAIVDDNSHVVFRNCRLAGNTGEYEAGAAAVYDSSSATFTHCTIEENHGANWAGGVELWKDATATFDTCTIRRNTALEDAGGVAIYTRSTATFTGCTIESNDGGKHGGGIELWENASAFFDGCTIAANAAMGGEGGGIGVFDTSVVTLTRCFVVRNASPVGAAFVARTSSTVILDACTVAGNRSAPGGSGIFLQASALSVRNAILWNEGATEIAADPETPVVFIINWSDVAGDAIIPGTGNLNANPLFADTLAYALPAGSPCVDAGDPGVLDIDGSRADMGAHASIGPRGDVTRDGILTANDAGRVLRSVVRIAEPVLPYYGDVTGNGAISSYDAAHILRKVIDPDWRFPVGSPYAEKPAAPVKRSFAWTREDDGWTLAVDDPAGVLAGEFVLRVAPGSAIDVTSDAALAWAREGDRVRVAVARAETAGSALFRVAASAAPEIESAMLNEDDVVGTPAPFAFALLQNAPNPFNPATAIRFSLPASGDTRLAIHDATGRIVRVLIDGEIAAGAYEIVWDGTDAAGREVASGVYLYRLVARDGTIVRRMVLVR